MSRHSMIPIALIGLALILSVYILQSNDTSNSVKYLYNYLTDFILTLSHWSGLSYYDVNALLFTIMMPLLSVVLAMFIVRNIPRKRQNNHGLSPEALLRG